MEVLKIIYLAQVAIRREKPALIGKGMKERHKGMLDYFRLGQKMRETTEKMASVGPRYASSIFSVLYGIAWYCVALRACVRVN